MATKFSQRDTVTINDKGQVTIPKHLRDEMGLETGDQLQFVRSPNNKIELLPKTGRIEDLFGILKPPGSTPITIEEMKEAAADGWAFGEPDESTWPVESVEGHG